MTNRPSGPPALVGADGWPPAEVALNIAADHPAFAGHFPGAPVLLGALLMALVMDALPPALASSLGAVPQIEQLKFLAQVGPGQRLTIRFEPQQGSLVFEVRRAALTIARGRLSPATTP